MPFSVTRGIMVNSYILAQSRKTNSVFALCQDFVAKRRLQKRWWEENSNVIIIYSQLFYSWGKKVLSTTKMIGRKILNLSFLYFLSCLNNLAVVGLVVYVKLLMYFLVRYYLSTIFKFLFKTYDTCLTKHTYNLKNNKKKEDQ